MLHRERVKDQMNHSLLLHPADSSSLRPLLLAISLLLFVLLPCLCDEVYSQGFTECKPRPSNCGDFNISYPFKSSTDPPHCAYPGLVLSCDDRRSFISIGGKNYQVTNINYAGRFLEVVDPATSEICFHPRDNITGNTSHFIPDNYSDFDVNFLSCSEPTSSYPFQLIPFTVPESCPDFRKSYYYWTNDSLQPGIKQFGCELVQVPVKRDAFDWMFKLEDQNLLEALKEGFTLNWTEEIWKNCSDCVSSNGACGFDGVQQVCYCPNNMYSHEVSCRPRKSAVHFPKYIVIGILVVGISCLLLAFAVRLLVQKRAISRNPKHIEDFLNEHGSFAPNPKHIEDFLNEHGSFAPKRYRYSDLKKITRSFSKKIGEGGYGRVFEGKLQNGRLVAVKMLTKSKDQDGAEFMNEVASIGRTSHVNVVTLLGFCFENCKKALVYEYMPNGSLDRYIYSDEPKALLSWDKLYQIALGIARGLDYLHRGCNTRIVHFDIKPHNILLNEEFCPKISDFGLAKLCPQKESALSMAGARGTIGYIAPEVFSRWYGVASTKSDVYSYGMMILEMVGGRKNWKSHASESCEKYFPHWVYDHLDRDGDLEAYNVTVDTEEIARKMILVGLWCVQTKPADRPTMTRVAEMLEGRVTDVEMPPKPFPSSPGDTIVTSPLSPITGSSINDEIILTQTL